MKIFNSLGHAFAWLASKIVGGAQAAATVATAAEGLVESPLGNAIAQLAGAKGQQVQADMEAVIGCALATASATGAAVSAGGLNITLDEAGIAAWERLISTVGGLFGKSAPSTAAAAGK